MNKIFKQWSDNLVAVNIADELDDRGKKVVEKFAWVGGKPLNKNSVALMTGKKSVNVIDVDTKDTELLLEPFKSWVEDRLLFSDTLIVESTKGYHFYFYSNELIKTTTKISDYVDIRGEGGVIFVHSDSKAVNYEVISGTAPTHDISDISAVIPIQVPRENRGDGYSKMDDLEKSIHFNERPTRTEVEEWLSKIDADTDYDSWVDIIRALNSWDLDGDEGLELAITWSKTSKSHNISDEELTEKYHDNVADVFNFYKKLIGSANKSDKIYFEKKILEASSEEDFDYLSEEISDCTLNNSDRELLAEAIAKREQEQGLVDRKRAVHWKKKVKKQSKAIGKVGDMHFPDTVHTQNGIKIMNTFANLLYFVENHSHHDYSYDVILKRFVLDNNYNTEFGGSSKARSYLFDELTRLHINADSMLKQHLDAVMFSRARNNLIGFINELPKWDGVTDYIGKVADTLTTKIASPEYKRAVLESFVVQAVSAWDNRKRTKNTLSRFESVMVFVGKQGGGKTTWARTLMPHTMLNYFKDGVELNPSDKDSYIEATQAGLVELGELDATNRKSDISSLKSFLSKLEDEFRAPYGRTAERYPRQTVFMGTVNNSDFLKDSTGSRRFLTLDVVSLSLPKTEDVLGMWSQALSLYLDGNDWRLPDKYISERDMVNGHFTDIGDIGDLSKSFEHALKNSVGTKQKYSVRAILKKLAPTSKFSARERSDFIATLDNLGITKYDGGKYYLPDDVFLNFRDDEIVEEFDEIDEF